MDRILHIGTRASPLALAQTEIVRAALAAAHDWPLDYLQIKEIVTRGDKNLSVPLAEIGGKGLFTEELDEGLRACDIDFAVHSLKDLPTQDAPGLAIAAIMARAPVADALIVHPNLEASSLDALPPKARIGTSSLRRKAQLLHHRPDFEIVPLRGNVGTRLKKLETENLAATLLAEAGLHRLALTPPNKVILSPDIILPAAAQGALAIQCRSDDTYMREALRPLHCAQTAACVAGERALLAGLDGSCRTPIAALAVIEADKIKLQARLLAENGSDICSATGHCPIDATEAAQLGATLAQDMKAHAPHLMPKGAA